VIALYCPDLPPVPGGVADHTLVLARALERLGAPPAVLGRRGDPAWFAPLDCRTGLRPGDVAGAARGAGADTVLLQYVPFLFARRGVSPALVAGVRAINRSGLRLAVLVHEPFVPFTRLPWLVTGWPMRWQLACILRHSSVVYAPVPRYEQIARHFAGPRAAVRLAPVGATLPISCAPREQARRALGLGDADVAIGVFSPGAAGFLSEWVGSAARRLAARPEVVWVVFGFGSERLPATFPAGARVLRLGPLEPDGPGRAMRALDVALSPYVDGLTMRRTGAMLALAHGVPTISSTGHLFDPQLEALAACPSDAGAFAAAVERVALDAGARKELAGQAAAYGRTASVEVLARIIIADLGGGA